jgi:hypothetical protein
MTAVTPLDWRELLFLTLLLSVQTTVTYHLLKD